MEFPPAVLRWRLLSAAVLLTIFAALLWADHAWSFGHRGVWLAPLALLFTGLAAHETLYLLQRDPVRPSRLALIGGNLLVVAAACGPLGYEIVTQRAYPPECPLGRLGWPLAGLAVAIIGAMAIEIRRFGGRQQPTERVALAALGICYIGLMMSFIVALRLLRDDDAPQRDWGLAALLSLVAVVKMSDTGAYTCGRLWGRNKLSPLLSPGKTWEGALGGLAAACLTAWLFFQFAAPRLAPGGAATSTFAALAYGLILGVVGILGDLAESLLKRDAGRKDSSTWLPGLGGVLDILDSVLLAAPVAFLCWAAGLVGPF